VVFTDTERSLDEAYKAAFNGTEDEHFNGKKIAPVSNYGDSVTALFSGRN